MNSPSNQVIEVSLDNETEIFEQQSFSFSSMETDLSPENLKEILARLNMSIRQAADEIGIANTTLSRYINRTKGKIRRMIRR
ncbi:helix-turn-helix domain-containing protein [Bacillus sp. NRRL B-14911]|uniref:helix-turn-helix domain-containing protein n=1 Tax=Bacillus sp. NRRL B-14911 TaxID=313627 RepID=UPI00055603B0|nr:helix-turn-helix transcriptional regulator [Bacillus sp. NRRL B-14911]